MFNLLSPSDLKQWTVWHYTKRLETETRPDHINYLTNQLSKLQNHDRISSGPRTFYYSNRIANLTN